MVSESHRYLWDGKRSQEGSSLKSTLTEQQLLPGLGGYTVSCSVNFWIAPCQRKPAESLQGLERGANLQLSCKQSCGQAFKQMLCHRLSKNTGPLIHSHSKTPCRLPPAARGYQELTEVHQAGDGNNSFFSKGFCPEDPFSAVKDVDTRRF